LRESLVDSLCDPGRLLGRLALAPLLGPLLELALFPADPLAGRGVVGVAASFGPEVPEEVLRLAALTEAFGVGEVPL
jgi:hypothetical protein